jgi:hypothetical protein
MKAIRFLSAGLLLLTLGFAAPVRSQQQDDKNKQPPPKQAEPPRQEAPKQEPPRQEPPKQAPPQHTTPQPRQAAPPKEQAPREQPKQQPPARQQQQPQHPTTTQHSAPPHSTPQQAYGGAYHGGVKSTAPTNGGVHPSGVPQHSGQVRSGFGQSRSTSSWATEHKTWQQRGGYNGYRIPENRFSLYFGSGHHFRISGLPILFVGGYPRFQYDGYWITFVDPWPDNWPPDWYETDDVYLEYTDDGYYLYDANYPGIGIAVTVSM